MRQRGSMGKLTGIDLKRARLVPSSVFASPNAVIASTDLSRAQKIEILRRWEFDVRSSMEWLADDRHEVQLLG